MRVGCIFGLSCWYPLWALWSVSKSTGSTNEKSKRNSKPNPAKKRRRRDDLPLPRLACWLPWTIMSAPHSQHHNDNKSNNNRGGGGGGGGFGPGGFLPPTSPSAAADAAAARDDNDYATSSPYPALNDILNGGANDGGPTDGMEMDEFINDGGGEGNASTTDVEFNMPPLQAAVPSVDRDGLPEETAPVAAAATGPIVNEQSLGQAMIEVVEEIDNNGTVDAQQPSSQPPTMHVPATQAVAASHTHPSMRPATPPPKSTSRPTTAHVCLAIPGLAFIGAENVSPIILPGKSSKKKKSSIKIADGSATGSGTMTNMTTMNAPATAGAAKTHQPTSQPSKPPLMNMILSEHTAAMSFTIGDPVRGYNGNTGALSATAAASAANAAASAAAAANINMAATAASVQQRPPTMMMPIATAPAMAPFEAPVAAHHFPSAAEKRQKREMYGELGCKCRRSHCLRLYCNCFQAGKVCSGACICLDCANTQAHSAPGGARIVAIMETLSRRPDAFKTKKKQPDFCACTTGCLKKYCFCFKLGRICGESCSCRGCQNSGNSMVPPQAMVPPQHVPISQQQHRVSGQNLYHTHPQLVLQHLPHHQPAPQHGDN